MERTWFQLAGPLRFIDKIAENVESGRNVVACVPNSVATGCREALRARFADGSRAFRYLLACDSIPPFEELRQNYLRSGDRDRVFDVASLAQCDSFRHCVFWIEPKNLESMRQWIAFVEEYAAASRVRDECERTVFCLVIHETCVVIHEDITLSYSSWDGHIAPLDIWSYVRYHREPNEKLDPFYDDLAGALVADIAGHDMELAEHLSVAPIDVLLNPTPRLLEYAGNKSWTEECLAKPSWAAGHFGFINGAQTTHAAILAVRGDLKGISRRVWQAESRVLFPLLEHLRIWLVPQAARLIRPPFMTILGPRTKEVDSVEDLELGQLEYHLAGTPLFAKARCLANMRRQLAHLEAVDATLILGTEFQSILKSYHSQNARSGV